MTATLPPTALDLRALAQKSQTLSGSAVLSGFARLGDGLPAVDAGQTPAPIDWQVHAEWREPVAAAAGVAKPQLWLHVTAQGEVPQVCQRCLGTVLEPVEVDRWFRFVDDESAAATEDDESEEDVLAFEPRFDLLQLLEDELLMALPLVPMHESCPRSLPMSAGELADEGPEDKPHPFAKLAALKGGLPPT